MSERRDLERDLEDWLEEAASPMPDRLAESVAGLPARHTQIAGSPRPWIRRAFVATAIAATVLGVALIGPRLVDRTQNLIGSFSSPTPTFEWDAVLNFRELNPSPDGYGNRVVWSYLRSEALAHDPSRYVPMPDYAPEGPRNWHDADYVNLFIGVAPGDDRLTLHPWGGEGGDIRAAIVAWRSPIDGVVVARGDVQADATCGDGTTLSIDLGSETLDTVDVNQALKDFQVTATVHPGDTLYFHVDPGTTSNCDTTWLRLLIEG